MIVSPFKEIELEEVRAFCERHGDKRLRSHRKYLNGDRSQWRAWVMRDESEEMIGFTAYNPNVYEMDSVTVVDHICRQKGIAKELMCTKIKDAKMLGIKVYRTTIGGTNAPSINLVLSRGFTLIGAETRDYGTILTFELELNR